MKRIILVLIMAISLGSLSAQECTLRLEMPATAPNPGEQFTVGVWMDVLDYPGYPVQALPTLKSGQMNVLFDADVLTPIKTGGPPALQKYAWNLNAMFSDYAAVPIEGYPNPGDLRFVSFTTFAPGMDPDFYGGIPMLMFELVFEYNAAGGDIVITWSEEDKTTKTNPNLSGGVKEKIVSFWTAWDNVAYEMTYVNIGGETPPEFDWTGAIDEVWNNPGNWAGNAVPGPADDVTIDAAAKAAPVIYGSAVTGALHLISGQLTIAGGGDLTTNGLFTNDGMLYMSNTLGMSASYIDNGGLAGVGTFQYDRDVFNSGSNPLDPADPFGWHYLGAPIDGLSTDLILDYYVNQWDEVGDMWMNYAGTQPCIPYAPAQTLDGLEAWSINFDSEWPYAGEIGGPCTGGTGNVVEFMGPFTALHTGGYSAAATFSGGVYSGWNAYGNPYASSIDPSLFNWAGYENTLYGLATYDGTAGNYIYSNLGNGYAFNVGPTQGFFVQATAPTTFALSGAERVHDNGTTIFKDAVSSLVTIEATGDGTSDLAYIRFMDAEVGMDKADFPKLFSTTEGLAQIYTTAGDEMLAVNALPATDMVPMGFTANTSGEYTISAIETSEFTDVVLEDRTTGEQTDLLVDSYTFNYTTGDDADRFFVHFTPLGIGDNAAASINIWSNDHKIYVQVPEINGDIVVFNMMGQEVIRTEIEPGLNVLPVNDGNAYYVVKVVSSDVAKTGKVYVK